MFFSGKGSGERKNNQMVEDAETLGEVLSRGKGNFLMHLESILYIQMSHNITILCGICRLIFAEQPLLTKKIIVQ